jgi:hypothetical protein
LSGYSDLPYLTADASGNPSPNQLGAEYLPFGAITLNSAVNWADPAHQTAIDPSGHAITIALGIPGVAATPTAGQFMDFYILHELAHSFGLNHDETQLGRTQAFYNEAIWNSCFH